MDHHKLGRSLGLFDTHELVGAGLPLWLPDGAIIRSELERFAAQEAVRGGCQQVYSPVLAKRELYERSGHWAKFSADMFPPMQVGNDEFVLRPANCPHHILIYAAREHSYRELPIRYAELAPMFRSELSGVLGGLSRVRQINLDDHHVFCTEEQIQHEISIALQGIHRLYGILDVDLAYYRLSKRDDSPKYLGDPAVWERAQDALRQALLDLDLPFEEADGEAAFYGPKIDVQIRDAAGREESLSTVQVDFILPERFDLKYVDASGGRSRPVMIHRGLLSAMDRLVAYLIERYDGNFPAWLAPTQVLILPVSGAQIEAAKGIAERFSAAGLRAECDASDNTLGLRVRRARERRIPYVAVVGDREISDGKLGLRLRDGGGLAEMPVEQAIAHVSQVVRDRLLADPNG